ncbi:MAG: DUF502 domain-containing protein [Oligoflexia bacterium]|nr:DUF502 domain-containing protein [Oligoflexia bacterium]
MNLIKKLFKEYFLAGILVIGPLAVCFIVVKAVIDAADAFLQVNKWFPVDIPGLGVLVSVLIILGAGFLGKNFLGKYFISLTSDVVSKVPVLGGIYKSIKQIFETLFINREQHFRRVVLVTFPGQVSKTLAFVTSNEVPNEIKNLFSEPMLSLYIPTSPIPTNGFYVFMAKKDVQETSLTVEQAFKVIVSLGLANSNGH